MWHPVFHFRPCPPPLGNIDPLWEMLYPAEQAKIIENLVESVTVREDGIDLVIQSNGILGLVEEMSKNQEPELAKV